MSQKIYLLFICLLLSASTFAQKTVSGTITDGVEPLIGASIIVKGYSMGAITDFDGMYSLEVPKGATTMVISYVGYTTQEVAIGEGGTIDITMSEGQDLEQVVIVGSRSGGRTKLETSVPVDIIDIKSISAAGGQTTVNSILNFVAPSFSSNTQTISDGTDHIDPASLRGLGPDQVLVLINGKRRHTTALVNVNGTFGRGNVGTDMNSIPVGAIERIEVLRDGAAAQYGSDAIAGVINIILRDDYGLNVQVGTGAYMSKNSEDGMDGEAVQLSMNYGMPVGEKGGYLNLTANYDDRNHTNRMKEFSGKIFSGYNNPNYTGDPGDDITESELAARNLTRSDFNMRVGQSAVTNGGLMLNSEIPLNETSTLYFFGGLTYRNGQAAGFYRLPYQERTVTDIYPNGFLPEIHSNIYDQSFAAGVRSKVGNWDIDLSNTYGKNTFGYQINNTLNASLEAASPTSFNAGGFSFMQNTTNFDVSQYFETVASGLNVAFGAEFRLENYAISAGEEGSYANYGLASQYFTNGGDTLLINNNSGPINTVFGPNGSARPGGSQVFPGFSPGNEVNALRNSVAAYADLELDVTEAFLISAALRAENYSDFGSTLTWKVTGRYKLTDNFSARAAASTGFRAPSLHQLHFNSTSTIFVDGVPFEVGTFSNDSRVAELLGIPELKQETSTAYSVGVAGQIPSANMSITVDAYQVSITDRVVYTGQFSGDANGSAADQEIATLLSSANASRAGFFANAIDSRTRGLDVVLTHRANLGSGRLNTTLAATFSQTELIGDIKTSPLLEDKKDTYFDRTSQIFLESAVPRQKINLTLSYSTGKFNMMLRNVYFGEVNEATNNEANDQTFAAKVVTDISVGYKLTEKLRLSVGANNLFDVYPDLNIEANQSSGRFLYSRRSQQFGANGRYAFARLSLDL
ncbi:MAG: iron complex outermembrane receptor protein [Saprospiraceae bacterium]|jgi:iron complex outermembrane receptor protein